MKIFSRKVSQPAFDEDIYQVDGSEHHNKDSNAESDEEETNYYTKSRRTKHSSSKSPSKRMLFGQRNKVSQPTFDEGYDEFIAVSTSASTTSRSSSPSNTSNNHIISPPPTRPTIYKTASKIRYINSNSQRHTGTLERALDAAQSSGKPLFLHVVSSSSSPSNSIFSNPQLVAAIEECFVPAVITYSASSAATLRRFGLSKAAAAADHDCLRLVDSSGRTVVGALDGISDDDSVERCLVQALTALGRHVPDQWRSVAPLQENEQLAI